MLMFHNVCVMEWVSYIKEAFSWDNWFKFSHKITCVFPDLFPVKIYISHVLDIKIRPQLLAS